MKNLATTGVVSTFTLEPVVSVLYECGMEELVNDTSTPLHGKYKVFVNGNWIGVCEESLAFSLKLRRKRRRKVLHNQVLSIYL